MEILGGLNLHPVQVCVCACMCVRAGVPAALSWQRRARKCKTTTPSSCTCSWCAYVRACVRACVRVEFYCFLLVLTLLLLRACVCQRMKRTWDRVSAPHMQIMYMLEELMESKGNYKCYRERIKSLREPESNVCVLPYLGMRAFSMFLVGTKAHKHAHNHTSTHISTQAHKITRTHPHVHVHELGKQ